MTTSLPFAIATETALPTRRRAPPERPRGLSPRRPRRRGRRRGRETGRRGPVRPFLACVAGVVRESRKKSPFSFRTRRTSPDDPRISRRLRALVVVDPDRAGHLRESQKDARRITSSVVGRPDRLLFGPFRTRAPSGGEPSGPTLSASRARSPRPRAASPAGPRARAARRGREGGEGQVVPSHVVDHDRDDAAPRPRRRFEVRRDPAWPGPRPGGRASAQDALERASARAPARAAFGLPGAEPIAGNSGDDREEEEEHPPTGAGLDCDAGRHATAFGRASASTFNARSRKDPPGTD